MGARETITKKLNESLLPTLLEVIDESHQHQGHGGWREGGETHFKVIISSPLLTGSKLVQHKTIMNILKDEMGKPIHALSIEIKQ